MALRPQNGRIDERRDRECTCRIGARAAHRRRGRGCPLPGVDRRARLLARHPGGPRPADGGAADPLAVVRLLRCDAGHARQGVRDAGRLPPVRALLAGGLRHATEHAPRDRLGPAPRPPRRQAPPRRCDARSLRVGGPEPHECRSRRGLGHRARGPHGGPPAAARVEARATGGRARGRRSRAGQSDPGGLLHALAGEHVPRAPRQRGRRSRSPTGWTSGEPTPSSTRRAPARSRPSTSP